MHINMFITLITIVNVLLYLPQWYLSSSYANESWKAMGLRRAHSHTYFSRVKTNSISPAFPFANQLHFIPIVSRVIVPEIAGM